MEIRSTKQLPSNTNAEAEVNAGYSCCVATADNAMEETTDEQLASKENVKNIAEPADLEAVVAKEAFAVQPPLPTYRDMQHEE